MIVLAEFFSEQLNDPSSKLKYREQQRQFMSELKIELKSELQKIRPDDKFAFESRSYTNGLVALTQGNQAVGIDCELLRPYNASILNFFSENEKKQIVELQRKDKLACADKLSFLYWTIKEAYGKTLGIGLEMDLVIDRFKFETAYLEAKKEPRKSESNLLKLTHNLARNQEDQLAINQILFRTITGEWQLLEPTIKTELIPCEQAIQDSIIANSFCLNGRWLITKCEKQKIIPGHLGYVSELFSK